MRGNRKRRRSHYLPFASLKTLPKSSPQGRGKTPQTSITTALRLRVPSHTHLWAWRMEDKTKLAPPKMHIPQNALHVFPDAAVVAKPSIFHASKQINALTPFHPPRHPPRPQPNPPHIHNKIPRLPQPPPNRASVSRNNHIHTQPSPTPVSTSRRNRGGSPVSVEDGLCNLVCPSRPSLLQYRPTYTPNPQHLYPAFRYTFTKPAIRAKLFLVSTVNHSVEEAKATETSSKR